MCCQISGLFNMVMVSENDLSDIYKEEVDNQLGCCGRTPFPLQSDISIEGNPNEHQPFKLPFSALSKIIKFRFSANQIYSLFHSLGPHNYEFLDRLSCLYPTFTPEEKAENFLYIPCLKFLGTSGIEDNKETTEQKLSKNKTKDTIKNNCHTMLPYSINPSTGFLAINLTYFFTAGPDPPNKGGFTSSKLLMHFENSAIALEILWQIDLSETSLFQLITKVVCTSSIVQLYTQLNISSACPKTANTKST
uniref:Uncharacterized protein n=1 Tax=Solanum lycopersicum TaxID=4081 RepID=A0A3Q7F3H5_SOLLC